MKIDLNINQEYTRYNRVKESIPAIYSVYP